MEINELKRFEIVKKIRAQVNVKAKKYLEKVIYPIRAKIQPQVEQVGVYAQEYDDLRFHVNYNSNFSDIATKLLRYCFVPGDKAVKTEKYEEDYGPYGAWTRTVYRYYYNYISRNCELGLSKVCADLPSTFADIIHKAIVDGKVDIIKNFKLYRSVLEERLEDATKAQTEAENKYQGVRARLFKTKRALEEAERKAKLATNEYEYAKKELEKYEQIDIMAMVNEFVELKEKIVAKDTRIDELKTKIDAAITQLEEMEFGNSGVRCEVTWNEYQQTISARLGIPADIIEKIIVGSISQSDREEIIRNGHLYDAAARAGVDPSQEITGVRLQIYDSNKATQITEFGNYIKDEALFAKIAEICYALSDSQQATVDDNEIFSDVD